MKITPTQKEQITKNIHKINIMEDAELRVFVQQLYLSKPHMDKAVFDYTLRGADIQAMVLRESTKMSPLVVMSELRDGEI